MFSPSDKLSLLLSKIRPHLPHALVRAPVFTELGSRRRQPPGHLLPSLLLIEWHGQTSAANGNDRRLSCSFLRPLSPAPDIEPHSGSSGMCQQRKCCHLDLGSFS